MVREGPRGSELNGLALLKLPFSVLCSHRSSPPEYLLFNCHTWLGGAYYWKKQQQHSRVTERPSSKSAQLQSLPAADLPIVSTGHFSFSPGSNCPRLSFQCHFLWFGIHSPLNFKGKAKEREEVCRLGLVANETFIGVHMVIFVLLCLLNALCFRAKKAVEEAFTAVKDRVPEPTRATPASLLKVQVALELKRGKKEIPT